MRLLGWLCLRSSFRGGLGGFPSFNVVASSPVRGGGGGGIRPVTSGWGTGRIGRMPRGGTGGGGVVMVTRLDVVVGTGGASQAGGDASGSVSGVAGMEGGSGEGRRSRGLLVITARGRWGSGDLEVVRGGSAEEVRVGSRFWRSRCSGMGGSSTKSGSAVAVVELIWPSWDEGLTGWGHRV